MSNSRLKLSVKKLRLRLLTHDSSFLESQVVVSQIESLDPIRWEIDPS